MNFVIFRPIRDVSKTTASDLNVLNVRFSSITIEPYKMIIQNSSLFFGNFDDFSQITSERSFYSGKLLLLYYIGSESMVCSITIALDVIDKYLNSLVLSISKHLSDKQVTWI